MAEKQQSPGSAVVATPRAAKLPVRSDEPALVVRKQPPRNVFIDEWFEVEIGLDLPRVEHPVRNFVDLELVPSLRNSKTGQVTPDFVLTSEPDVVILSPRTGSPRRNRKIRCRIRSTGPETVGSFFIQFSHRGDHDMNLPFRGIATPLLTRAVGTVDYKIVVAIDDEQWESIWYKDEGGRDKCMEITAELYNKSNLLQTGEQVPLHLTLLYDNDDEPVRVTKQDLLRTLGPGKLEIDRTTGRGKLRFRIEDVSKNHQGQDFRVEVSPDYKQRKIRDIAPGMTPAVSVRSKRNKRARVKEVLGKPPSILMGGVREGGERKLSPTSFAPTRGMMHPSEEQAPRDSPFDGPDSVRLRDAMKGVIQWTEEVVTGLYPLQWQVIGYAQNADGSPDYTRPYHNMPNPNAYINRVISMYTDSTREQLRALLHAVEQATSDRLEDSYPLSISHQHREMAAAADPFGLMHNTPPLPIGGHVQMPAQLQPTMANRRALIAQQQHQQQTGGLHPNMASLEDFSVKHDFYMSYPNLQQPASAAAAAKFHPGHVAAVSSLASSRHLRSGPGRMAVDDLSVMQHRQAQVPHTALATTGLHRASSGGAFVMGSSSALTSSARGSEAQTHQSVQYDEDDSLSTTTREAEVEYVLAKQYKAVRTGERLGFPAYSASKEILGFYRESSSKVGVGQFIPIGHHREDFGPMEILQATQILEDALRNKSDAVHILKDWGNITNLIDHALVYDWSKDIGGGGGGGGASRVGGVPNTNSESSSGTE